MNPYANYVETLFADAFCKAFNDAAKRNPHLRSALNEFESKTLQVQITNFRYSFVLTVNDGDLLRGGELEHDADLVLSGRLESFLKAVAKQEFTPAQMDGIEFVGDMKLAQRLYQILANMEFDWEEEIAAKTGDIAARRVGNLIRWGRNTFSGSDSPLAEKVRNVLANETYILPERERVMKFMDDVDSLQADLDRLEKRVDHIDSTDSK